MLYWSYEGLEGRETRTRIGSAHYWLETERLDSLREADLFLFSSFASLASFCLWARIWTQQWLWGWILQTPYNVVGTNLCQYTPVFRIHEILGWIRIRRSMPLTHGPGSGFGSWIWILLFSSLNFKMPAKYYFLTQFSLLITFWRYIYIIFQR